MALRTIENWATWLSDIILDEELNKQYATIMVESDFTEDVLSELSHELLLEMNIVKPGHRAKILKKAKTTEVSTSTKMVKSDVKLPSISKNCSPSQFRKFLIDWDIYKSEHLIRGSKCNNLLYSACDVTL